MKIKNILFAIVVFTGVHHSASAQQENLDRIRDKFRKAGEVNRQEKLFVHTDKAFYLAGEIVWFKLYAEQQSLLSSIAYVDLLDVTGKTVLAARISLQDQKDNGSMLLPLSLSSGNYKLRAYTSNMRNLAEESFFEQPITVINPFREPTPANPVHTNAHEAAFFPEGGNLVKGLESKLAFKVTDHYGNGIDCSGEIVDISGKTIVGFSSLKFGMGQLLFTPVSQGYRAIIRTAGDTFSVSLPEVMENGYVMSVQKVAGNMEVTVKSTHTAPHYISLVSRHHDRLLTTQSSLISNGRLTFTIPANKLGAGVNQLTLFDATNIPVCERLVFIPPPVTSIAGTSTDKKVYSTREQVNISVNTNDTARRAVPANLSLAVVPVDSFNASDAADIRSYFWMSADLKGHIESPSYYFGTPSPELETATENLMLTHGWRRFNWKRILNPSVTSNRFPVEAGTQEIKVKVTG
ncbi:MAG TPA: hypothetical protein VF145_00285, partial [Chitinophagaceae bacterium]